MASDSGEDLRLNAGYRDILRLTLPITLALLVPQINFITNNVFLAGLGESALAGAGLTGVYYLIFAVIGSGLNNGIQMLMARRAGENRPAQIGILFYNGVRTTIVFSLLGILITWTLGTSVLRWSVHDQATAEQVISFLRIRIWGLPFLYMYGLRNALLVGTGKTKLLIWGTLAEALVNIFLDYALIYGRFGFPELGFNGAAYASVVAEAAGLLVVWWVIRKQGLEKVFSLRSQEKPNAKIIRLMVVRSSPLMLQYAISIITWEYFYILIEHYGARELAVSNMMRNIFGVVGIFSWAFAATTNTLVSNLIGQGRTADILPVISRIVRCSLLFCVPILVVLNVFPGAFVSLYGLGAEFIDSAVPVLRVVSVALFLQAFSVVWLNSVTGTGNTRVNLWIEVFAIVVYVAYVTLVLETLELGIIWGWGSEVLYWVCMFFPAIIYMKSGKWREEGG